MIQFYQLNKKQRALVWANLTVKVYRLNECPKLITHYKYKCPEQAHKKYKEMAEKYKAYGYQVVN